MGASRADIIPRKRADTESRAEETHMPHGSALPSKEERMRMKADPFADATVVASDALSKEDTAVEKCDCERDEREVDPSAVERPIEE